jgi:hypothetical protein
MKLKSRNISAILLSLSLFIAHDYSYAQGSENVTRMDQFKVEAARCASSDKGSCCGNEVNFPKPAVCNPCPRGKRGQKVNRVLEVIEALEDEREKELQAQPVQPGLVEELPVQQALQA